MGGPFDSHAVGLVVRSEHKDFAVGEHIFNAAGFRERNLIARLSSWTDSFGSTSGILRHDQSLGRTEVTQL